MGKTKKTSTNKPVAENNIKTVRRKKRKKVNKNIVSLVFIFVGLFFVLGYFNIDSIFVKYVCGFVKKLIGYGYIIFPVTILICTYRYFINKREKAFKLIAIMSMPIVLGSFIALTFAKPDLTYNESFSEIVSVLYNSGADVYSGGLLGGLIAYGLVRFISIYGAIPVSFILFTLLFIYGFDININKSIDKIKENIRSQKYETDYDDEYEDYDDAEADKSTLKQCSEKSACKRRNENIIKQIDSDRKTYDVDKVINNNRKDVMNNLIGGKLFEEKDIEKKEKDFVFNFNDEDDMKKNTFNKSESDKKKCIPADTTNNDFKFNFDIPGETIKPEMIKQNKVIVTVKPEKVAAEPEKKKKENVDEIIKSLNGENSIRKTDKLAKYNKGYKFPTLDLLESETENKVENNDEISKSAERINDAMKSFGVDAKVTGCIHGPTITSYSVRLGQGIKLSKLTGLSNDLALSLATTNIRIAPIENETSTVGIEVPNKNRNSVYLKDLVESDEFKNAKSDLSFAIGKNISGKSIIGNISKLPHLLIAGTTGSGKSVCMNSLIISLLYKSTPEEIKFIMIDPKMVELGIYNGIPHLLVPVVTDPKKAASALNYAVGEMLKRYKSFAEVGVRDIAGYNNYQKNNGDKPIPKLVIVIDELADLMMIAAKEVEDSICRIAQMGRAAGVHLVVATQRPSADIITGLMKANIPSRIAFSVSSAMESRIILDNSGAEKLIGYGDMLYSPIGVSKPMRVQGAFVSDEERERVIDSIKEQVKNDDGDGDGYDKDAMNAIECGTTNNKNGSCSGTSSDEKDELFDDAVDIVVESKQASTSLLQRKLKVGYARAARIIDQMEAEGIVGPFDGAKPRQVLKKF